MRPETCSEALRARPHFNVEENSDLDSKKVFLDFITDIKTRKSLYLRVHKCKINEFINVSSLLIRLKSLKKTRKEQKFPNIVDKRSHKF